MKGYVVGFMFSKDEKKVVLIRKNHPEWQKGKFNGVGGKIEEGESPNEAMCREFKEETGIDSEPKHWRQVITLYSSNFEDWFVCFYVCFSDYALLAKTATEEEVVVFDVAEVLQSDILIPNLKWLIPMCLDKYSVHGIIYNGKETA